MYLLATDDLRSVALDLPQEVDDMTSKDLGCRFLDTLSIGPETRSDYARALRKFETFMSDKALPDEESTIEVLRTWLRQEAENRQ